MENMPVCRDTLQRARSKSDRFLFKMYKNKIWCIAVLVSLVSFAVSGITSASVTPQVEGGYHWSMALKSDGTIWAWGENKSAQFGNGTHTDYNLTPIQTTDISNVTVIAAGVVHAMAIKSDGALWTWGGNGSGVLGIGSYDGGETPTQVSRLSSIIAIDGGYQNSMALKSDGTVWTWGANTTGQLGDGTNNGSSVPVQVSGLSDVVVIASGVGGNYGSGYSSHSLALKSDGKVWAWGANGSGQLGDGTNTERKYPVQVSDLTNVIGIAAGGGYDTEVASSEYAKGHSLALKTDGTVWSWGWNWAGQLGDGSNTDSNTPVQVSSLNKVIAIASNGWDHCLALKSDGTVWTWGNDGGGELGDGGTNTNKNTPVQASGLTDVAVIGGGYDHSLAVKLDGTVWAWGSNWNGELGNGTTTDKNIPVQANINLGEITAQSPTATTDSATNVASTSVTLTGTANSNGLNAAVWFEYGTTSVSYNSESSAQIVTGSSDTSISIDVDGLSDGTTYYYRIAAQNPTGTTYGNEMSFTTTDTTPPSGSVNINYGDTYANSKVITLTLSATDNVGITGYYVSTNSTIPSSSDPSWATLSPATSYNANVSYTLSGEDSDTTVYVWFMDTSGYISDPASDTIVLDTTAPTVTITSPTTDDTYKSSGATLSLRGTASDSTSGVESVEWSNDQGDDGTATGTANWSVFGINLSGGTNIITVIATDNAGNIGADTITVTVAECNPSTITSTPSRLTISKNQSKEVILTVAGKDSCAVEGETVTATTNRGGNKRISISPSTTVTGENGQAKFTITATNKTGNAIVTFKAGTVKKILTVKVRK